MSDDPLDAMERSIHPYRERFTTHDRIPQEGRSRDEVLAELQAMADEERPRWQDGYASGAVYAGEPEHVEFLNRAYALHSQSNPLHLDLWPSAAKFEGEIVAMTAGMLGAGGTDDQIVGTVTSGGTESILMAVRAYRNRARADQGITEPQMVIADSAHAAFDKAAEAFGVEAVKVPVGPDSKADVTAMTAAITDRTVLVVGSSPAYPHGLVDPIEELSEAARERGIGFHTDACLGGFVLPWAEKLGADVPPFDFRLPGVTSMSCDTHKFGYAAKGTSVVLYRGEDLRHHQFFTFTDWPGGLYATPTFAGSRPGGLSAACWAAMVATGEQGYLDATRGILDAAAKIKAGIAGIDGIEVIGDPLFNVAFRPSGDDLDIYRVLDEMTDRGWSLNGLQRPPALHICCTRRHAEPGVAERFLDDLTAATAQARTQPTGEGGSAPLYGFAASLPDDQRGVIGEFLAAYMDRWYRP
jgi:glutamate/tyrosine decarboxylase-like PLP-dependent enzyme